MIDTDANPFDLRPTPRSPRPTVLRSVVAACVAAVVVVTGACSGDDDAETTTTTEAVEPDDETTETAAPLDDDQFEAEIAAFDERVVDAGTDVCALNEIITGTAPPDPANSPQSERLVELYVELLRAIAASAPDSPDVATGFATAADDLEAEAADAGYPPDLLSAAAELPPSLASDEFLAASTGFGELVSERCAASEAPEEPLPDELTPGTPGPTG